MMEKSKRCEECGEMVDPEDQFCGTCGMEIRDSISNIDRRPQTCLQVVKGLEKDKEIPLERDELTLGRGQDVDLYLEDSGASREHARIKQENGHFTLIDLESSNGTYLNGIMITGPETLSSGDLITVGDTVMEFQLSVEESLEKESSRLAPVMDQVVSGDSINVKGSLSKILLIGGAAIAILVCLVSAVLIGALVILPILKPDSPTVADNPNSTPAGGSVEFPPVGEDPPFPPSGDGADFPPMGGDLDIPPGMATVEIVNNHSKLVCFISISPSEDDRWGGNWLEEGEILRPGSAKTFYIEAGFIFDWLVQDCDGTILIEAYELRIWDGLNILNIEP
jgi:pSer/pThr/pTyr-binding forkhead associated (FHA) protein